MWFSPGRLSADHKRLLKDSANERILLQVSLWEIQIKHDLGKLPLPKKPAALLPHLIEVSGLKLLPIQDQAIFLLGNLPPIHRDPFDRLLVAHALTNGWTLMTADETLKHYPVLTC